MISEEKMPRSQWPTNEEIIEKVLKRYQGTQSHGTRNSCLNYFFKNGYFGYDGHVFDIQKGDLTEFLDYLDGLKTISLSTKKTKYAILKSFLLRCEDLYEDKFKFTISFPNKVYWSKVHKKPKSNSGVFLEIDELEKILNHVKKLNFKYYLIFRLLAESGLRKGGIINIDYDNVNLNERYIETIEKNGRCVYYISEEMREYLKIYIEERKLIDVNTKALFLSTQFKRFSRRVFNVYLKNILSALNMKKDVTCHTFRRSINNFREKMGCDIEKRSILLNHSVKGVNFKSYVEKDQEKFLGYFDTWNPFTHNNAKL